MTKIRLAYIHEFRDRHGKVRRYVRLPGGRRIPLPGAPGTDEFMDAYRAALAGDPPRAEIGASRTKPGTVNAAIVAYYNSVAFLNLAVETQRTRRNLLEGFRRENGGKRIARLETRHIADMIADVLEGLRDKGEHGDPKVEAEVNQRVRALCARFPIYPEA